ncbi:DNA-binding transcriptional regulator, MarR family [Ruminococcus sp. YE71]|uniref:MarR family winged helix-turn-helix transcriptional regulator n=1 Tax=unclassified Ruminococcus TaxID=2608920 RepID=UPI000888A79E|nr:MULTISPECIES: MarR family transcriptional regulator [unclassified Ruminococcus]SDA17512.1 DNA-binding transcriptional regulator, MarR family [Ruminococcus sp. YE78]SFW26950.1 DNA-binding transcriptional regulator, MarR family [Ruminococcus sp. YE71]
MEVRDTTEAFLESVRDTYMSSRVNGSADYLQGECRLLSMLSFEPDRKKQPGELAKTLGVSTARIASILRTLEKKNYITRETSAEDKRKVYVEITDEGRQYLESKRTKVCGFFDMIFSGLETEERDEFIRLIRKLSETSGKADMKE